MKKHKKVIAFFKELGFAFTISRFDDRSIAQKLVCLLELRGINLGYPCSIYVRGPYSPNLTEDLFSFKNEFENLETSARSVQQIKRPQATSAGFSGSNPSHSKSARPTGIMQSVRIDAQAV